LKRGSMLFWLSVSSLFFVLAPVEAIQANSANAARLSQRANELNIAGLLPGRTSIVRAEALLGKASKIDRDSFSAVWNSCLGIELIVDVDGRGIVQLIRATKSAKRLSGDTSSTCDKVITSVSRWTTGRGLRLGSSTSRVLQLYGPPDSRSPSTKDGQRLELLHYAFDWAGPDVPQVMQVLCTVEKDGKPGRVVEIMLAASSL
jgi:hypothetical protein